MSRVDPMPSKAPKNNTYAYLASCARVERQIARLAQARGIALTVEIDPGRASYAALSGSHQIELAYAHRKWIVAVDHDTFMDDEFFKTLVLHHLPAAIHDLASAT
jgi:hypothetical protein